MSDALKEANRQWEELINTPLWELEDFPSAGHLLTLATEFRIAPRLHVKRRRENEWVIVSNGAWRNHDGEWEIPSLPSSQSDDFKARTGYKFIDAMQIAMSLPVTEPDELSRRGFFNYTTEVPPRKA